MVRLVNVANKHWHQRWPFQMVILVIFYSLVMFVKQTNGQTNSQLWWHDFKNLSYDNRAKQTNISPSYSSQLHKNTEFDDAWYPAKSHATSYTSVSQQSSMNIPSDDELMTQASKLNSQMVRIAAPKIMLMAASNSTKLPSQPYTSSTVQQYRSASAAQEPPSPPLSTTFDDNPSEGDFFGAESSSYYNAKPRDYAPTRSAFQSLNSFSSIDNFQRKPDDSSSNRIWSYFDSAMNKAKQRDQSGNIYKDNRKDDPSDYFNKHFNRDKANRQPTSSFTNSKKSTQQQQQDDKNRILNFNFNRKQNPEEKEKWRQLIQSIFDSSPRNEVSSYGAKNRFSDMSNFNFRTKNKPTEPPIKVNKDEDVLKSEKEEKVNLNSDENETGNWNLNGDEPEESSEEKNEPPQDNDDSERDNPVTGEEVDEEEEEEVEDVDDDNQYLKPNNTDVSDDGVAEKRSVTGLEGSLFGTRLNRLQANKTSSHKPKFTMHFQMGSNELINSKGSALSSVQTTTESFLGQNQVMSAFDNNDFMMHETTTPSVLTSTDSEDIMDDELTNNTVTTTEEPDLQSLLIKKRKPQRMGKWMDSETFELNDDDLDSDEEANKPQNTNLLGNDIAPKVVMKRVLTKPLITNRIARQNFGELDDNGDELARLAQTLQGTPGEDYPIFGLIPRTSFSCRDHQWPGYYADVETQCQVFHICQRGGRRNSFLCPNGTMFNQQLFICDWWHNVQCETVAEHYGLNEQIYDYNWESKRMDRNTLKMGSRATGSPVRIRNIRRMAVMDDIKNDIDSNELTDTTEDKMDTNGNSTVPTTTLTSTSTSTTPMASTENSFTTEQLALTEAVFGSRKAKSTKKESEGLLEIVAERGKKDGTASEQSKSKRFLVGGVKGGTNQLSKSNSKPPSSSTFFSRHKFASHSSKLQLTPTPEPKSSRFQTLPVTSSLHNRGKYYRT